MSPFTRRSTLAVLLLSRYICILGRLKSGIQGGNQDSLPKEDTRSHVQNDDLRKTGVAFPAWLPQWYQHGEAWIGKITPQTSDERISAQYYSQGGEDKYAVENFFRGLEHGTYLEMGAFDGVKFSNTLHLRKAQGWRGLLIEPNPTSYSALVRNRPDDVCVNAAICANPSLVHFVEAGGATAGIYEFMSASFLDTWYKGLNVNDLPTIQCLPLNAILSKLGFDHIDFWSLDVEGGEMEVLRTVDFNNVEVGVMTVEADSHSMKKNEEVRNLLTSKGFTYHGAIGNNDWFTGPSFVPPKDRSSERGARSIVNNPRRKHSIPMKTHI